MIQFKFKKLNVNAKAPIRAKMDDKAWDLTATSVSFDKVNSRLIEYGSGLAFECPEGYSLEVRARSSVSKTGQVICNGVGTIDNGYRGEVGGRFFNVIPEFFIPYEVGERFAQILCPELKYNEYEFIEVDELSETDRGSGGFGSTGK